MIEDITEFRITAEFIRLKNRDISPYVRSSLRTSHLVLNGSCAGWIDGHSIFISLL